MGAIVFDPRGVVAAEPTALAPRALVLHQLRLGVLDNTKWNANRLLRKTAARLGERVSLAAVNYSRQDSFSRMPTRRCSRGSRPRTTSS